MNKKTHNIIRKQKRNNQKTQEDDKMLYAKMELKWEVLKFKEKELEKMSKRVDEQAA